MSIETDLYNYISASSSLQAIFGTNMFPIVAYQGAGYPFLTFQKITYRQDQNVKGVPNRRLDKTMYQFDIYTTSLDLLREASTVLFSELTAATAFTVVESESPRDYNDDRYDVWRRSIDIHFWHYQAGHDWTLLTEDYADILIESGALTYLEAAP